VDLKNGQLGPQGKGREHLEKGCGDEHKPGCYKNPKQYDLPHFPFSSICLEVRRSKILRIPYVKTGPQNDCQAQAHGKKSSQDNMKEQRQTEQPDSQKSKEKTAQDQIEIAKGQAQVNPSLVGRVSLDEPGTIDFFRTFDPGLFD
jgi:hypothetical protein